MKNDSNEKKKGGKLKWIIIAIIVLCILGAVFGTGDDSQTASTEGTTETNDSENANNSEEVSNIFYPGDVLEADNLKLTYISCGEYSDSNMFVKPGEGNKFVSFEFEFENTSDSDISVGSFDFSCYADGYEASQALITSDNSLTSITTLSAGRKATGIVVFEVSEDASEIEVEYETNFWTQDKAIFVYQ